MNKFFELFNTSKPVIAKISINNETNEEYIRVLKDIMEVLKHGYHGILFENKNQTAALLARILANLGSNKNQITMGLSMKKASSKRLFETSSHLGLKFVAVNESGYSFVDEINKLKEEYNFPVLARVSEEGNYEHNIALNLNCADALLLNKKVDNLKEFKTRILENFPIVFEGDIKTVVKDTNRIIDSSSIIVKVSSDITHDEENIKYSPKLLRLTEKVNLYDKNR